MNSKNLSNISVTIDRRTKMSLVSLYLSQFSRRIFGDAVHCMQEVTNQRVMTHPTPSVVKLRAPRCEDRNSHTPFNSQFCNRAPQLLKWKLRRRFQFLLIQMKPRQRTNKRFFIQHNRNNRNDPRLDLRSLPVTLVFLSQRIRRKVFWRYGARLCPAWGNPVQTRVRKSPPESGVRGAREFLFSHQGAYQSKRKGNLMMKPTLAYQSAFESVYRFRKLNFEAPGSRNCSSFSSLSPLRVKRIRDSDSDPLSVPRNRVEPSRVRQSAPVAFSGQLPALLIRADSVAGFKTTVQVSLKEIPGQLETKLNFELIESKAAATATLYCTRCFVLESSYSRSPLQFPAT